MCRPEGRVQGCGPSLFPLGFPSEESEPQARSSLGPAFIFSGAVVRQPLSDLTANGGFFRSISAMFSAI